MLRQKRKERSGRRGRRGHTEGQSEIVSFEALVPTFRLDKLTDHLKRLERTAKRAGLPLSITIGQTDEPVTIEVHYEQYGHWKKRKAVVPARRVTMNGIVMPRMRGWTFVARLTPTPDFKENIISNIVPDLKVPERYHAFTGACDQCGTRRERSDTFLLHSDEGGWKQVGRNCLFDFLQTDKIDAIIQSAALLEKVNEASKGMEDAGGELGGGGRRSPYFIILEDLTAVAWLALQYGYRAKSAASEGKPATADQAMFFLGPPPSDYADAEDKRLYREYHNGTLAGLPAAKELAEKAVAWARSIPDAEAARSEYLRNLKLLSKFDIALHKHFGLVASIVGSYLREHGKALERAAKKPSTYQGVVGEKIFVPAVKIVHIASFDTEYGVTYINIMVDEAGNKYIWKSGTGLHEKRDAGQPFSIMGTVKAHEPDRKTGEPVTYVTRVTVDATGLPAPKKAVKNPLTAEQKAARKDKARANEQMKEIAAVDAAIRSAASASTPSSLFYPRGFLDNRDDIADRRALYFWLRDVVPNVRIAGSENAVDRVMDAWIVQGPHEMWNGYPVVNKGRIWPGMTSGRSRRRR